jgi:hypothetical protein
MSGKTQVSDCTSSTVLHHTCVLIAQYHENKLLCYNQLKAVRIEFFFILKVAIKIGSTVIITELSIMKSVLHQSTPEML